MDTEYIYIGHDNTINLVLKNNSSAYDLSAITQMTLSFGTIAIESSNTTAQGITWAKAGYDTGEVRIQIGNSTRLRDKVSTGKHQVPLTLYDASNTNGVVWGEIPIIIRIEVEGSTS